MGSLWPPCARRCIAQGPVPRTPPAGRTNPQKPPTCPPPSPPPSHVCIHACVRTGINLEDNVACVAYRQVQEAGVQEVCGEEPPPLASLDEDVDLHVAAGWHGCMSAQAAHQSLRARAVQRDAAAMARTRAACPSCN